MTLTVAMITGNENVDQLLRLSIRQSQRIADEVLVVDSSTDGTGEVAEEEGARVVRRAWPGDYSLQRNAAFAAARGDWVCMVDADEVLDDRLVDVWPDFVNGQRSLLLPTYNFTRQEDGVVRVRLGIESAQPWYPDEHLRLLRRSPYVWFHSALHEWPIGAVYPQDTLPFHIYHYGWARRMEILEDRIRRRNAESLALGGHGSHSLAEPFSDNDEFGGEHPRTMEIGKS